MKADDQFLRRRHVRENNAISSEVAASRKVALNVRRAALKKQVEEDKEQQKKELQQKFGKTFYVDRLWKELSCPPPPHNFHLPVFQFSHHCTPSHIRLSHLTKKRGKESVMHVK